MRASICMATYNGAVYLREQIDSILSQLLEGDELLISDDGSTDDTPAILKSYGNRLRVVNSSRIGGVVRNFERVLYCATGEVIVLADQDDVWLPGKLARLRAELAHCDLVMSNAFVVDESLQGRSLTLFDQLHAGPGALQNYWRNSFVGCCMAFRSSLLQRVLPFPSGTPWHDWLLGLLASIRGTVRFVSEPQMLYRRHAANVSATGGKSGNGLFKKLALRLNMARALSICLRRADPAKHEAY